MASESATAGSEADGFAIFDAVCVAAGITPGAERIGVFLDLPRDLQERLWGDAAARLDQEEDA